MVLACRAVTVTFFTDDVIDSGKMFDRIPGFKQATGSGVRAFHFVYQVLESKYVKATSSSG